MDRSSEAIKPIKCTEIQPRQSTGPLLSDRLTSGQWPVEVIKINSGDDCTSVSLMRKINDIKGLQWKACAQRCVEVQQSNTMPGPYLIRNTMWRPCIYYVYRPKTQYFTIIVTIFYSGLYWQDWYGQVSKWIDMLPVVLWGDPISRSVSMALWGIYTTHQSPNDQLNDWHKVIK